MAIDFSFPEEIEFVIQKVRDFMNQVVRPAEKIIEDNDDDRKTLVEQVVVMRPAAKEWGSGSRICPKMSVAWDLAMSRWRPFLPKRQRHASAPLL